MINDEIYRTEKSSVRVTKRQNAHNLNSKRTWIDLWQQRKEMVYQPTDILMVMVPAQQYSEASSRRTLVVIA